MLLMSGSMHWQGLLGGPRRSAFSEYAGNADTEAWIPFQTFQAVGGAILFIGMLMMIGIIIYLSFFAPETPKVFENWGLWIGITVLLIVFAYTIPFIDIIQNAPPGSPGFKLY